MQGSAFFKFSLLCLALSHEDKAFRAPCVDLMISGHPAVGKVFRLPIAHMSPASEAIHTPPVPWLFLSTATNLHSTFGFVFVFVFASSALCPSVVAGAQGGAGARDAQVEANLSPHQAKRRRRGRHVPGMYVHATAACGSLCPALCPWRRCCPHTHEIDRILKTKPTNACFSII